MRGIRKFFLGAAAAAAFGLVSCEQLTGMLGGQKDADIQQQGGTSSTGGSQSTGGSGVAKYDYNGKISISGPGAGTVTFFGDKTVALEITTQSMTAMKLTGTYTGEPKDGATVDVEWTKVYMPGSTGGLTDVSDSQKLLLQKLKYKISGRKIAETDSSGEDGGGDKSETPDISDLSGYYLYGEDNNWKPKEEFKLKSSGGTVEITAYRSIYRFNLCNPDTDKWSSWKNMDFQVEQGIKVLYPQNQNDGGTILTGLEKDKKYTVRFESHAGQKILCTVRTSGTSNPVYQQEPVQQVVLLKDFYLMSDENGWDWTKAQALRLGDGGTATITAALPIYKFQLYNPVADDWWSSYTDKTFQADEGISILTSGGDTILSGLEKGKKYTVKFTFSDGSKFTCAVGSSPRPVVPEKIDTDAIKQEDLPKYFLCSEESGYSSYDEKAGKYVWHGWKPVKEFQLGAGCTATITASAMTLNQNGGYEFKLRHTLAGDGVDGGSADIWIGYDHMTFSLPSGVKAATAGGNDGNAVLSGLKQGMKYTLNFAIQTGGKILCTVTDAGPVPQRNMVATYIGDESVQNQVRMFTQMIFYSDNTYQKFISLESKQTGKTETAESEIGIYEGSLATNGKIAMSKRNAYIHIPSGARFVPESWDKYDWSDIYIPESQLTYNVIVSGDSLNEEGKTIYLQRQQIN